MTDLILLDGGKDDAPATVTTLELPKRSLASLRESFDITMRYMLFQYFRIGTPGANPRDCVLSSLDTMRSIVEELDDRSDEPEEAA